MVGKLIEIENEKVVIKPVCHTIKPLKDIIDFYPQDYRNYIAYIHYMTSLNPVDNPFADLPEEEKAETIQRYLNIDIDEDSVIFKEGLECMKKLYATPVYNSYASLKKLLDQVNEKLANIQLDFSKEGNSANVTGVVKALSIYKKEMREAKKDYLEEQGDIRGRGGVEMAYDENDLDDDLDMDQDDDEIEDDDLD